MHLVFDEVLLCIMICFVCATISVNFFFEFVAVVLSNILLKGFSSVNYKTFVIKRSVNVGRMS